MLPSPPATSARPPARTLRLPKSSPPPLPSPKRTGCRTSCNASSARPTPACPRSAISLAWRYTDWSGGQTREPDEHRVEFHGRGFVQRCRTTLEASAPRGMSPTPNGSSRSRRTAVRPAVRIYGLKSFRLTRVGAIRTSGLRGRERPPGRPRRVSSAADRWRYASHSPRQGRRTALLHRPMAGSRLGSPRRRTAHCIQPGRLYDHRGNR